MREITSLIIHCTDTPTGRPTTVEDIDSWHHARGWLRQDSYRCGFNPTLRSIGYHYVIYVDGTIRTGRQIAEVGAHVSGMNSNSIGIAMAGKGVFSPEQWDALKELAEKIQTQYPKIKILGHADCPSGIAQGKTCPNFDVAEWLKNGMMPNEKNVV